MKGEKMEIKAKKEETVEKKSERERESMGKEKGKLDFKIREGNERKGKREENRKNELETN